MSSPQDRPPSRLLESAQTASPLEADIHEAGRQLGLAARTKEHAKDRAARIRRENAVTWLALFKDATVFLLSLAFPIGLAALFLWLLFSKDSTPADKQIGVTGLIALGVGFVSFIGGRISK